MIAYYEAKFCLCSIINDFSGQPEAMLYFFTAGCERTPEIFLAESNPSQKQNAQFILPQIG